MSSKKYQLVYAYKLCEDARITSCYDCNLSLLKGYHPSFLLATPSHFMFKTLIIQSASSYFILIPGVILLFYLAILTHSMDIQPNKIRNKSEL